MNIAILSLNPGTDRYIYLGSPLTPGAMNRSVRCVVSQGSKGANQAIVLSCLGVNPRYYSFRCGKSSDESRFLEGRGITEISAETATPARLNIKVMDESTADSGAGGCTEINERGGPYTASDFARLADMLAAGADDFGILSITGSIPLGLDTGVYFDLIKDYKARGKTVVLDCAGEALARGIEASPDLIKPNIHELSTLVGCELSDDGEITDACRAIYERLGTEVICTTGPRGAIYVGREGVMNFPAEPAELRGFSGAGDTFLAAYTYSAYLRGESVAAAMKFASLAAAAKISLEGTALPEEFLRKFRGRGTVYSE